MASKKVVITCECGNTFVRYLYDRTAAKKNTLCDECKAKISAKVAEQKAVGIPDGAYTCLSESYRGLRRMLKNWSKSAFNGMVLRHDNGQCVRYWQGTYYFCDEPPKPPGRTVDALITHETRTGELRGRKF